MYGLWLAESPLEPLSPFASKYYLLTIYDVDDSIAMTLMRYSVYGGYSSFVKP